MVFNINDATEIPVFVDNYSLIGWVYTTRYDEK